MLLWFLSAQDSTRDLFNAKQMANKTNHHWKNRPGRSLPHNTCTREHNIDMHCDSGELAFLYSRLPFCTTPARAEYTTISEATIDPGNNLLQDQSWDTNDLNLPHRSLLPPEDKYQSASHLEKSDPLAVEIIATEASMDGFIE